MTIDTMSMAVSLLITEGIQATVEYPGNIHVIFRQSGTNQEQVAVFGTAGPQFAADLYTSMRDYEQGGHCDSIDTDIPSSCDDAVLVAKTIANAIDPDSTHRFTCAYCRNLLNPGDKVVYRLNSDTSIDVFCSDTCKGDAE